MDWQQTSLTYFLWLPAGKDEFGFKDYEDAPYRGTAFYRHDLENTIAAHLKQRATDLRDRSNRLAGMDVMSELRPNDAPLGLRMVRFKFRYENELRLPEQVARGPISGTAIILSNGLYAWSFNINHEFGTDPDTLREPLTRFLIEDFVANHVRKLFDFRWNESTGHRSLNDYHGILTYYQLDLLFNGLFDRAAHPHFSLGETSGDQIIRRFEENAKEAYSVGALIKSLSMMSFAKRYVPLYDNRKDYSLRNTFGRKNAYVECDPSMWEMVGEPETRQENASTAEQLQDVELLLSRLSYAGMEQFLRVANSFGVTHYKAGLDHCRAELVNESLVARKNRGSEELRRPSLSSRPLTLADVEAYHTLVAGKLPVLAFLNDLAAGLSEVSQPLTDPLTDQSVYLSSNGARGAIEWKYSESTLKEAMGQFERHVAAIGTDVAAIDASLRGARSDQIISELTEARKLSEIESEQPDRQSVVLRSGEWDKLNVHLTRVALILAAFELYASVGVLATARLLDGPLLPSPLTVASIMGLAHWAIPAGGAVLAFFYFRRKARAPASEQSSNEDEARHETHVFDYSSLRESVIAPGGTMAVVHKLRGAMMDFEVPESTAPCTSFSTFRETPSIGVELIKFSLESAASENGISYIFHLEIDRRMGTRENERLRDVRLVIRGPAGTFVDVDIDKHAERIIVDCVKELVLINKTEDDVREFFHRRFGWRPVSA